MPEISFRGFHKLFIDLFHGFTTPQSQTLRECNHLSVLGDSTGFPSPSVR